MNDSMTRLIKPLITMHLRALSTNQFKFVQNFFFKSVQTHFNFYSVVMYIQNYNFL